MSLSGTADICHLIGLRLPMMFVNNDKVRRRGHHGRDRMVIGFTTTCAISAYHH
jgi:hypothetical protein